MSDAADFARLAQRLKDAGETGLRRELFRAVDDAVDPFTARVGDPVFLYPYMPNRYADVLAADEKVTAVKRASSSAYGVSIRLQGRLHRREVARINQGILRHPVFADSEKPRSEWTWVTQLAGMRPGFFTDAAQETAPRIRDDIVAAMNQVAGKITRG